MDRKLLIAMLLSGVTVVLLQFFTNRHSPSQRIDDVQRGRAYRVLTAEELQKPLNLEVDFIDTKIPSKEPSTSFETELCSIRFSGYGGSVSNLTFNHRLGKERIPLKTIAQKGAFNREEAAFLLALDEKTPYFYELVSQRETPNTFEVTFQKEVSGWRIRKIYAIKKNAYQLNLTLEFEPKAKDAAPILPRLFIPVPFIGEVIGNANNGIAFDSVSKKIQSTSATQLQDQAWAMPEIFGGEDRYFAHVLIADAQQFAHRGYYKEVNDKLYAILEGPQVSKKGRWELSFYLGPKDIQDLTAVEPRLEGLLNFSLFTWKFSWFTWLCKLLLKLLEYLYSFLHNYGLAIIVLTILIKIPLLPLTLKCAAAVERYQKFQPQIMKIRQKFRHDAKLQHEEFMRFHREHNISPATQMVGCLPLLIDFPIMIALYQVLGNYMDLYQAPFIGWVVDLSSKDPYYILPVLMGAFMLLQQRLTPPTDEKQRVVMLFMSLFMTVLFANFAAGLVLYWLTKNVLTIVETYLRRYVTG